MISLKTLSLNTIRARITMLSVASVVFLAAIGGITLVEVSSLSEEAVAAANKANTAIRLLKSTTEVQHYFQGQVQEWKDTLLRGNDPALFKKYSEQFEKKHAAVNSELRETRELAAAANLPTIISANDVDDLRKLHDSLHQSYLDALKSYNPAHATAGQEVDKLVRGVDRPFTDKINGLATGISIYASDAGAKSNAALAAKTQFSYWTILILLALSIPLLGAVGYFIARGIVRNLALFLGTLNQIQSGDFTARARIKSRDELGALARAFNDLLDSRVQTLANIQRENNVLNESVLNLLRAVAQLAKKDLTVHIPVSEDVTGAVSDALNLFASETSKVLQEVSNISADVTTASLQVQKQSDSMLLSASEERAGVEHTAQSLATAAHALREIADLAQQCNLAADNAIQTTRTALLTVNDTVSGINNTRDVIRETEKRIKRLGERSQEISGAVNLINMIAERTHILALNASMHAASAGEAGRGFAVVADEVQRLAENSRQATQQIAALVNNIQVETSDTVNTMNNVITQIVEGSRLAEQAGQQMQLTQQTTAELVASVRQIASNSEEQAKVGQELVDLASAIRISSEKTSEQLLEQSTRTNNLVEYAKRLLATVRVFKLPA
ncbi:MAG TPA: methyl-accepting chemotaxis protein [Gallionellaceae bacterium]